jgi:hypothetical protein
MKKAMKKLMAALLAVAMVCAMAIPAFADGSSSTSTAAVTKYTITAPKNGHTYEIYQIFTGDYDALQPSMLTNIKWGENGTGTVGAAVEQNVLNALSAVASSASDKAKLDVIENYVKLDTTPVAIVTNGSSVEVVGGYYLIKDKDGSLSGSEPYTTYLVSVVGHVTINPKSSAVPEFNKKLKDTNDSTGEVSRWQDSADYDIGDYIPFRLQGTVPADYDSYSTYYYAFHDKEEAGLTFDPSSVEVFVGDEETGTKITTGYTVDTNPADGCTFEIVFDDLKNIPSVTAKSIITVTYKSQLNGNAVLGAQGNVNTAKLEYSNNPRGNGTGTTPWDNVIVFTYKVVVNKVDQDNNPLVGAQFTLTKKTKNGTDVVKTMTIDSSETQFTLSGLDDGEYTLTETVTPAHYNTISPITFTVNADHTITWETERREDILTSLSGDKKVGEITFSVDKTAGTLTTNVINNIGTTLPGTGGIGTTIFYVIGGGLMVAAAILLITKKRMENR